MGGSSSCPSRDSICCDNMYLCSIHWFEPVRELLHLGLSVQVKSVHGVYNNPGDPRMDWIDCVCVIVQGCLVAAYVDCQMCGNNIQMLDVLMLQAQLHGRMRQCGH